MIIKGHLKSIILKLLMDQGGRTGSELTNEIENRLGSKPSYGSVYPLLQDLDKKGLLRVEKRGREKRYFLTEKGKSAAHELNQKKDELLESVLRVLRTFKAVFEDRQVNTLIKSFEGRRKGEGPHFPELLQIHELILSTDVSKRENKVRSILKSTLNDLEQVLE